jgi:Initiation factor 2 subunit family
MAQPETSGASVSPAKAKLRKSPPSPTADNAPRSGPHRRERRRREQDRHVHPRRSGEAPWRPVLRRCANVHRRSGDQHWRGDHDRRSRSRRGHRPARPARGARGSAATNPAFDVTPAELVTAIVTERGIASAPYPQPPGRPATATQRRVAISEPISSGCPVRAVPRHAGGPALAPRKAGKCRVARRAEETKMRWSRRQLGLSSLVSG